MEKRLSEISRQEWIAFQWIEITEMGGTERVFIQGFRRTPDEAADAQSDWDSTVKERSEVGANG
jgi:hypothetical protein